MIKVADPKVAWPVSSSYQRQYVNRPWVPVRPARAA